MKIANIRSEPHDDPSPSADGFADLVREHHRDLLVYASALARDPATARDLVQEAFIAAYEKRGVFDVTRDFGSWMRGIVRNKWREWLRKNRRYDLGDHELARIDADVAAWQEARLHRNNDLFAALEECCAKLPDPLRSAVESYYYEGRTGEEVAEQLHTAPAAIRKRLQRARILLKQCLDQHLGQANPIDA
ncbi:MAG TPA: sigma-70 family RNA polymerase sigma factor [Bacteroidia bacterium]|nr:sigma-70 family RNA polymerase sigma factor [Bacteroidia bacterium]